MQMQSRASRYVRGIAVAMLALAAPGLASGQTPAEFVPVTDAMLQDPAPDDWLTWRRTLDGWGYSPLNDIDHRQRQSDSDGLVACTRPRGNGKRARPDRLSAVCSTSRSHARRSFDAIDAVTGDLIWEYRPRPS